jgi:aldehyde dehydrogenase (NAD+)
VSNQTVVESARLDLLVRTIIFMSTITHPPSERFPEVDDFLSRAPHKGIIDGQLTESSSNTTFVTNDPGSGIPIAEVCEMSAEDVDAAVKAGASAFRTSNWACLPPNERSAILHRWADAVEQRIATIAQIEAIDAGKVFAQASGDVQNFVDTLRYFADLAQHVDRRRTLAVKHHEAWTIRHPWGVCGFIFPWNFPILLLGWGIAPALAAGNSVVVKPAEDSPLSTLYVAQLALEVGIPNGVINVVPGRGATTGAALAGHSELKRMSFTGSPEVGRRVAEACGRNLVPVKLELGGKGAAVVFDDVDVAETANKLVGAITFHAGQVCCNATRWLVHRRVYDHFVDECVRRLKDVRVGYQLHDGTQMGPVISERQQQRILSYLRKAQEEGADMVLDGGRTEVAGHRGYYVKPALLSGTLDNVAAREEIFGPVAYLAAFDDEQQAINMANDTDYGLANSVWTSEKNRAIRVSEALCAGNAWINSHNVFPHGVPYAGIHKSGMGGGVLSIETLMDYLRSMSVVRPL